MRSQQQLELDRHDALETLDQAEERRKRADVEFRAAYRAQDAAIDAVVRLGALGAPGVAERLGLARQSIYAALRRVEQRSRPQLPFDGPARKRRADAAADLDEVRLRD